MLDFWSPGADQGRNGPERIAAEITGLAERDVSRHQADLLKMAAIQTAARLERALPGMANGLQGDPGASCCQSRRQAARSRAKYSVS